MGIYIGEGRGLLGVRGKKKSRKRKTKQRKEGGYGGQSPAGTRLEREAAAWGAGAWRLARAGLGPGRPACWLGLGPRRCGFFLNGYARRKKRQKGI